MKNKPKIDSVKFMNLHGIAVSIPKKTLLEKLGFKSREKSLQDIAVLYDDDEGKIIGLQFNFLNSQECGEVERELFINPFKAKVNGTPSLIQKSGVKK